MGQQHRKDTKRRRRHAYIKRQKEIRKNSGLAASVPLAKKISQPETVAEKAEIVQEADAPAKKAPAKKTPAAKKAPAKKAPAKKADAPAETAPEAAAE